MSTSIKMITTVLQTNPENKKHFANYQGIKLVSHKMKLREEASLAIYHHTSISDRDLIFGQRGIT